ncbi:MAG: hypothetical protein AB1633_13995, partial [Elusimicrobiota bacterium]
MIFDKDIALRSEDCSSCVNKQPTLACGRVPQQATKYLCQISYSYSYRFITKFSPEKPLSISGEGLFREKFKTKFAVEQDAKCPVSCYSGRSFKDIYI